MTHRLDESSANRLWLAMVVGARFLDPNENLRLDLVGQEDSRREAVEITMDAQGPFWEWVFGSLDPATVGVALAGMPVTAVFDRQGDLAALLPPEPGAEWGEVVYRLRDPEPFAGPPPPGLPTERPQDALGCVPRDGVV
ncbi:MAG: hypothetical protein GXX96_19980 [Planctomycetaceae bacterium]|nr:hypothetical protein [Planctomycetaceae bacterium]